MRGILPIIVGAALGALVTILLSTESADDRSAAAITGGPAPSTAAAVVAEPDLSDPDTAATLGEISSITDPAARRQAALDLLDVYGHHAAGIDTVAASLTPTEAVNFRIHAIVNLGSNDMEAAFAAAMALPDHEQRRLTLLRLAPVLAEIDPHAAIAARDQIESPGLEAVFVAALLEAWAILDPARVFSFLESKDPSRVSATDLALDALAASNPERLLAVAGDLPRDVGKLATAAALESLIERDPKSALSRIDALPLGSDRSRLEHAAAELYGEQDPEGAWEWATTAQMDAQARVGVVRGIQKVDPDLAWDIMLSQLNSTDDRVRAGAHEYLLNYVNAVVNSESAEDVMTGLDRLLSLNDPRIDAEMQTNLLAWANRDPEAALEWSLRNMERIDAGNVLSNVSSGLARTNIDLARQTVFRLDEEHRRSWATGVGRTLAQHDLAAARSWAYQFPSGPLRDAGLHEVIRAEAHGGAIDRQVFDQFSSDRARGEAASTAARRFACDGRIDVALEIARTYITDQRLLEQTEQGILESGAAGSIGSFFLCQLAL